MVDWSAGEYERTAAELEPAARHVVALAALLPGDGVLDLACGTGNAALLAAAAGARVTGLDGARRVIGGGHGCAGPPPAARPRRASTPSSSSATHSTCRSTTGRSRLWCRSSASSSPPTPR